MMKTIYRIALIGALVLILMPTTYMVFAGGKTIPQIIGEAKSQITEVTVGEIKNDIDSGKNFVLLDVRTSKEFNAGHLAKGINIPRGTLEFLIGNFYPNKDTEIVLYCRTDARAALCTNILKEMGYTNVKNLKGGFKAWGEAGYSIYNRHGEFKMIAFEKKE
jgi:rhodanese-related sulfurtransferase